jgi:hypothetical protein
VVEVVPDHDLAVAAVEHLSHGGNVVTQLARL